MAKRIIIIDDNASTLEVTRQILVQAGYEVSTFSAMQPGLQAIAQNPPDGVLLDIAMPGVDGLEACRRLRLSPQLVSMKIFILSGKRFDQERDRALRLGANAYITKPITPAELVRRVDETMHGVVKLTYWGVRGTLPVTGHRSLRYGGNTPCVTLSIPDGRLVIFDAGSGIYELSRSLAAAKSQRLEALLLVSHPHWDHVNAFPFFAPLYQAGNRIEMYAPGSTDVDAESALFSQMGDIHFPISSREFAAQLTIRGLSTGSFERRGLKVSTMALSHPGLCLGYRVEFDGISVCYVTDNELFDREGSRESEEYMERLAAFAHGTDVLITDTTYTDAEYPRFVGWGHSRVSEVVELAVRAEAHSVHLFHHDPSQSDDDIDRKHQDAAKMIADRGAPVICVTPSEGQTFEVKRSEAPTVVKIAS